MMNLIAGSLTVEVTPFATPSAPFLFPDMLLEIVMESMGK